MFPALNTAAITPVSDGRQFTHGFIPVSDFFVVAGIKGQRTIESEGEKYVSSAAFQELNLSDDFMFAKVMEDPETSRRGVEKILNVRIRKLHVVQTQRVFDIEPDSRGIRLDVFLDDEEKNRYTVEMQTMNEYNLDRRSRYYHSVMDLDLISKGSKFKDLKDGIVIFICLFDPYRLGLHRYTFQKTCQEAPRLKKEDGTQTIMLFTEGNANDVDLETREFLQYVKHSTNEVAAGSEGELVKYLHKRVMSIKQNRAREAEYMKLRERDERNIAAGREIGFSEGLNQGHKQGLAEGLNQGHKQGLAEGYTQTASKMKKAGFSAEVIAECTGLTPEEIEAL